MTELMAYTPECADCGVPTDNGKRLEPVFTEWQFSDRWETWRGASPIGAMWEANDGSGDWWVTCYLCAQWTLWHQMSLAVADARLREHHAILHANEVRS